MLLRFELMGSLCKAGKARSASQSMYRAVESTIVAVKRTRSVYAGTESTGRRDLDWRGSTDRSLFFFTKDSRNVCTTAFESERST